MAVSPLLVLRQTTRSGETLAGAVRRMDWVLKDKADVLVVETGANDGLRGQDPAATRANIPKRLESVRTPDAVNDRVRHAAFPAKSRVVQFVTPGAGVLSVRATT